MCHQQQVAANCTRMLLTWQNYEFLFRQTNNMNFFLTLSLLFAHTTLFFNIREAKKQLFP